MKVPAKYTVDITHDGQLEGLILRSREAHARITTLDLAPARALAGVTAVSLLGDDKIVRYVGEPIAAVAAKDRKAAMAALAAIKLTYEKLPAVVGPSAGRKDGPSWEVEPCSGNVRRNLSVHQGGTAHVARNISGTT